MLKAVFFDLDGTLLPLVDEEFVKVYFKLLTTKMVNYGFDPEELVKHLLTSLKLMYKNDGSKTNAEVFWDYFETVYDKEMVDKKIEFDKFYTNEFKGVNVCIGENPYARDIVEFVKNNNLLCILSTNPIIPYDGAITRMSYVGLKEEDFDFITAYENFNYTKPNPMYFKTLLDKFNLKSDEVILFGNNELEDAWCAKQVGIKTYLIKDYLMDNDKLEEKVEIINMEDVIPTIVKEISNKR